MTQRKVFVFFTILPMKILFTHFFKSADYDNLTNRFTQPIKWKFFNSEDIFVRNIHQHFGRMAVDLSHGSNREAAGNTLFPE